MVELILLSELLMTHREKFSHNTIFSQRLHFCYLLFACFCGKADHFRVLFWIDFLLVIIHARHDWRWITVGLICPGNSVLLFMRVCGIGENFLVLPIFRCHQVVMNNCKTNQKLSSSLRKLIENGTHQLIIFIFCCFRSFVEWNIPLSKPTQNASFWQRVRKASAN